jgi:hypothetical protein
MDHPDADGPPSPHDRNRWFPTALRSNGSVTRPSPEKPTAIG